MIDFNSGELVSCEDWAEWLYENNHNMGGEDIPLYCHHTSLLRHKRPPKGYYYVETYKGRFGKGYRVFARSKLSTQYQDTAYWIEED